MSIAFLGNRLQELGGFQENSLHAAIRAQIKEKILEHKLPVLTSLAPGIERWAGVIALENKIPYHVYVPHKGYELKWPKLVQKEYQNLVKRATKVTTLSDREYNQIHLTNKDKTIIHEANHIYLITHDARHYLTTLLKKSNKEYTILFPEEESNEYFIPC